MNERVYHLKLLRRIDFIGIGLLVASVSLCPLSMTIQHMITGQASLTDYLSAVLMLLLLPFGILMLGWASSKIIVNHEGLEYHTPGVVLKAKWRQLQNLGYRNQGYSGRSLVVNPTDGEVTLKSWAKPIKGILRHKPSDTFILVAWFKDGEGNLLEDDIVPYLPSQSLVTE
jgi:hypothetical protein